MWPNINLFQNFPKQRYNCYKHHWSDTRKSVSLEVTPGGIDQIDPHTNRVVCSYDYRNVEGFVEVSDYQGGFCILYGGFSRLVWIYSIRFVCTKAAAFMHLKFLTLCLLASVCLGPAGRYHPQRHRACRELHRHHATAEEGGAGIWELCDGQVGEVQLGREHHFTGWVCGAEDHFSAPGKCLFFYLSSKQFMIRTVYHSLGGSECPLLPYVDIRDGYFKL